MCDDLDPEKILKYPGTARFMRDELRDISDMLDKYCNDNRLFLFVYANELTQQEVKLWKHDLQSLKEVVNIHKVAVETKVKQVMPPSQCMLGPMTRYETEMVRLKRLSLKLREEALFSGIPSTQHAHPTVSDSVLKTEVVYTTEEQAAHVPAINEQAVHFLCWVNHSIWWL